MNKICKKCFIEGCEMPCVALEELYRIWNEQNKKDKTIRVRNLKRRLGIREAEPSNELRILANKIIRRYPEFDFIREWDVRIGYVISQERKQGEKITYADCRKVQEVYKAYLPYDFIITFYERNTGFLNENQLKILMYHELRHIGIGPKGLKINPHDIEDFSEILDKYGLDWNNFGKELPDILGGD
ncbi:putative metallopeptidase [Tissierella praeacuta]|uniref:putative metallopeptidase n=1 Tax=Tissierella praeacuta TaxID=43131 RepID=UPI003DA2CE26